MKIQANEIIQLQKENIILKNQINQTSNKPVKFIDNIKIDQFQNKNNLLPLEIKQTSLLEITTLEQSIKNQTNYIKFLEEKM